MAAGPGRPDSKATAAEEPWGGAGGRRLAKVWPGAWPVRQSWWLRQECAGCWGRGVFHAGTLGSALALVSGTEQERVQPPHPP